MDDYVADVLIMGHTHRPYIKYFGQSKLAINAGSVGKSKDGNNRAAYLMLTLNDKGPLPVADIIRVSYTLEEVQQAILQSSIPNIYANLLIKA